MGEATAAGAARCNPEEGQEQFRMVQRIYSKGRRLKKRVSQCSCGGVHEGSSRGFSPLRLDEKKLIKCSLRSKSWQEEK